MNKALAETFMEMVRINSESGEEREFILYLKDLFTKELKGKFIVDPCGNLIGYIPSRNTTATAPVLFGVHADTVKPGRNIEPILENGIIRSNGETILGADNKAGIAELFEAIRRGEQHPPLEIVVSTGEEIGHLGSKSLDATLLKSKMGFVIDSDNLENIVIGGPSHMRLCVDIIGKAAHAGVEPEKGISSIKAAAYGISMLREGWIDEETTVNVGIINGGQVLNAVPERTNVKIECRSQSHGKCLSQSDLIKEVFLTAAKVRGAKAEIRMELGTTAFRISENARVVKVAKKAISRVGLEPRALTLCGGSDATSYNEKNIETIVIGTGARAVHTTMENIALEDMERAVAVIHYIFEELSL